MNEEKLITGYHGTKRENIDSICKNNFSISLDKENKLFLGYGVYFFYSCEDALDWNIKKFIEKFKYLPEYKIVINKYGIIESNIYVKEDDILDLDNKEKLYRLEILIKKFEGKFVTKPEYIRAKNKTSAIINILYNRKLMNKKILSKTFFEQIKTKELNSFKNYPRKMFCIKDTSIINKNKEEKNINNDLFDSIIYFYR